MARMILNDLKWPENDLKLTSKWPEKWPQNDIEVPDTFVDITIDRIFRILSVISHRTNTLQNTLTNWFGNERMKWRRVIQ